MFRAGRLSRVNATHHAPLQNAGMVQLGSPSQGCEMQLRRPGYEQGLSGELGLEPLIAWANFTISTGRWQGKQTQRQGHMKQQGHLHVFEACLLSPSMS